MIMTSLREVGYPGPIIGVIPVFDRESAAALLSKGCNGLLEEPILPNRLEDLVKYYCHDKLPRSYRRQSLPSFDRPFVFNKPPQMVLLPVNQGGPLLSLEDLSRFGGHGDFWSLVYMGMFSDELPRYNGFNYPTQAFRDLTQVSLGSLLVNMRRTYMGRREDRVLHVLSGGEANDRAPIITDIPNVEWSSKGKISLRQRRTTRLKFSARLEREFEMQSNPLMIERLREVNFYAKNCLEIMEFLSGRTETLLTFYLVTGYRKYLDPKFTHEYASLGPSMLIAGAREAHMDWKPITSQVWQGAKIAALRARKINFTRVAPFTFEMMEPQWYSLWGPKRDLDQPWLAEPELVNITHNFYESSSQGSRKEEREKRREIETI